MKNYLLLREKALANITLLFDYWKLQYTKINEDEYDFINPTRQDNNFGACRFNIKKGMGADFTGSNFTKDEFNSFGMGFSREDFNSFADGKSISVGFDVIGLTQRLHNCPTYRQAAELLDTQLADISKSKKLESYDLASAVKRQQEIDDERKRKVKIARRTWDLCVPIHNTLGQTYLNSRMIYLETEEPSLKYHPKVYNREVSGLLPAMLLKCTKNINSSLEAIHRIYLDPITGKKANIHTSKLALGNIKGLGIWLESLSNKDYTKLCIVEGPENALTIRSLGYNFVVSTINANNFSNIDIPETVQELLLFPDGDEAGRNAAEKAVFQYSKVIKNIKVIFPPKNPNNPKWDWNDEIQLRGKNVRGTNRG